MIAVSKDYARKRVTLNIEGAGMTKESNITRGGFQGGVRTPLERNVVIKNMMQQAVLKWEVIGMRLRHADSQ